MSVRVVVAGDHQLVLEAFAETLNGTNGLDVVGLATTYEVVLPAVERHRPTVLLLGEPTMGGKALRAATDVRARHPKCGVALMVGAATPAVVDRAVAAGALGIVPKNARLPQLITTLMGVAGGCLTVDPALLRPPTAGESALSVREMDVLRLTMRRHHGEGDHAASCISPRGPYGTSPRRPSRSSAAATGSTRRASRASTDGCETGAARGRTRSRPRHGVCRGGASWCAAYGRCSRAYGRCYFSRQNSLIG